MRDVRGGSYKQRWVGVGGAAWRVEGGRGRRRRVLLMTLKRTGRIRFTSRRVGAVRRRMRVVCVRCVMGAICLTGLYCVGSEERVARAGMCVWGVWKGRMDDVHAELFGQCARREGDITIHAMVHGRLYYDDMFWKERGWCHVQCGAENWPEHVCLFTECCGADPVYCRCTPVNCVA